MLRLPVAITSPSLFPQLHYEGLTLVEYRQYHVSQRAEVFFQEHCFIVVLTGQKVVHLPGNDQVLAAGSTALLRKGCYSLSEALPNSSEPYRSLLFFLPEKLLRRFAQTHANLLLPSRFPEVDLAPLLIFPATPALEHFYAGLEAIFPVSTGMWSTVLPHLLSLKYQELLLLLLGSDPTKSLTQLLHTISHGRRLDLETLLNKYFTQPLSVPELASLSGRSVAAFKRDVHAEFGLYPGQWVKRKRLEYAQFLLQHSSRNVAEVADAVGFDSSSAFIHAYKRHYGTTPHAARRAELAIK